MNSLRNSELHWSVGFLAVGILTHVIDTTGANGDGRISEQRVWSLYQCKQTFASSIQDLSKLKDCSDDKTLVWDKVGTFLGDLHILLSGWFSYSTV